MRKVIILIIILIGAVILISVVSILNRPKTTPTPLPVNSYQPVKPNYLSTDNTVYRYIAAKPGITRTEELEKLPDLKSKTIEGSQTQYHYLSPYQARDNLIIAENGVATFERRITLDEAGKLPSLDDYFKKYGGAEAEYYDPNYYSQFEKVYLYATLGFALVANPYTKEIDEIYSFSPQTKESYLNRYGSGLKTEPVIHKD